MEFSIGHLSKAVFFSCRLPFGTEGASQGTFLSSSDSGRWKVGGAEAFPADGGCGCGSDIRKRPRRRRRQRRRWKQQQQEAPPQPHHLHHLPAPRAGEGVRKVPLPRRVLKVKQFHVQNSLSEIVTPFILPLFQGGAGHESQPARSQSAGKKSKAKRNV